MNSLVLSLAGLLLPTTPIVEPVDPETAVAVAWAWQNQSRTSPETPPRTAPKGGLAVTPKVGEPSGVADPYHYDYPKFHAHILAGHRGVLFVGVPDTLKGSYTIHSTVPTGFGGLADGSYDCFLQNGEPVMVRREVSRPATPFSQTPAVVVSGSTQITGARNVVVPSTSFPGVAPYQGRIRTLAPLGILGGTWTSNCPTGVG